MTPRMRDILKFYNDDRKSDEEIKKEKSNKDKCYDIVFGNLDELKEKLLNKESENKVKNDKPKEEKLDGKKEERKKEEEKKDDYTAVFGSYESLKEKLLDSCKKSEESMKEKRKEKEELKAKEKPDFKITEEIQEKEMPEAVKVESIGLEKNEPELELSSFNEIREELLKKTPKTVIHKPTEEVKKKKTEKIEEIKATNNVEEETREKTVQEKEETKTAAPIEEQISKTKETVTEKEEKQEEYEFSSLESLMEDLKKPHIPPPISEEEPTITEQLIQEEEGETTEESIKEPEIEKSEEKEEQPFSPFKELEKEIERTSSKEDHIKRVPERESQITAGTLEYSGIDFYLEANKVVEQAINQINTKSHDFIIPVLKLAPTFVNNVLNHEELLALAIQKKRYSKWLVSHQVNVAIISLKIGMGLNLPEIKLNELTVSALFHDIGMLKIPNSIIFKHGRLANEEFDLIKKHPEFGVELISQLRTDYPYLLEAIYQEHERYDGSGYPRGLRGNEISMYARIIGLADTLEALLHGRAYRDGFITQKAIQTIIQQRAKLFDPKVLRAMIDTISIFPVGSYVKLNTGELARVISINKQRPVRPTVEVIRDKNGEALAEPYQINLEKEPLIYITKQIS
ncbi:MAG: HD-GYP domain-containing protein [Candidatus Marinimicrobia bacterium]|nr:HD-GYP domain-containing protein [Candidatus Neomarinimicrobiota bacterium]